MSVSGKPAMDGWIRWVVLAGLAALVALAPLPYGSVPALAKASIAASIGLLAVLAFGLAGKEPVPAHSRLAIAAVLACIAYLVIQVLPLGAIAPGLTAISAHGLDLQALAISLVPGETALLAILAASYVLLYLLIVRTQADDERAQGLLDVMLIVGCVYALIGIAGINATTTLFGAEKPDYVGYATGPFVNRNSFATYLALASTLALTRALAPFLRRAGDPLRLGSVIIGVAAFLLLATALLATGSRMGLASAGLGWLVLIAFWATRTGRGLRAGGWLLLLFGALGIAWLFADAALERVSTIGSGVADRTALYAQVLDLIAMRPLTGFGGGAFQQAFQLVHALPVDPDLLWSRAHSTYLTLWVELGLIFGTLPVLVVFGMGWRLFRAMPQLDDRQWALAAPALGALVIAATHSLFDFSLEVPANAIALIVLLAIGRRAIARPA
ncbi:MAG: O-antigen ligase family protein [Devosia sp.]|uniref:O-antigen ligase family protein n=1 Tax=Devosia sp. TaxID=1871048 RepID=UPI0024CA2602|nr:O-antigen ligase family protein [Devosia sp.]UYO01228.1 MAG: O-antigen ligase family protein [Devosia sp.]